MPVFLPGLTAGLGYGGASYAYSPYGSGVFPRLPVPTTGGYGGAPYGYGSYGSLDVLPPRLTGANSLDGYRVEVFFSEEMADNAALLAAANYVFSITHGVALTTVSVGHGTAGTHGGYTSVIVTHTGSTLGGSYVVTVNDNADPASPPVGPNDLAGNVIGPPPTNSASFSAFGDTTTVTASLPTLDDGRTVQLAFSSATIPGQAQNLLTEAEFTPGVDSTDTYEVTTVYPVTPTVGSATQDALKLSEVSLDVHPMTSTTYSLLVGPSAAFSYNGLLLPDDDPTFTGVEVGTGTSSASSSSKLLLSKDAGVQYGWSFGDTSGLVVPGSTYRVDFAFSSAIATITPSVFGSSLGTFSVSDGGIQVDIVLSDVAGVNQIDVSSGAYTASVVAAWNDGSPHTLSLIRNIMGGFYSVLFDGTPILTFAVAAATGVPTYSAGAAFVLATPHKVELFKITALGFGASSTLFTSAWNFIHGLVSSFTGSAVLTRDRLLTDRGPLVRGWGDATPARKDDVEVRVNSTAVTVASVNPYVGEIYPTIPIPLATAPAFATGTIEVGPAQPAAGVAQITVNSVLLQEGAVVGWANGADIAATADAIAAAIATHCSCSAVAIGSVVRITAPTIGTAGNSIDLVNTSADPNIVVSGATLSGGISEMEVEADYIWFSNPPLEIEGLNTRGLTLNKWDRSVTHTPGVPSPIPATAEGAGQTGRFPMGIALGPYKRESPIEIGHRYIGFQRDYSALLNEPTTLIINQNPHRVSVGGVSASALIESAAFDGTTTPPDATPSWTLAGVDGGSVVGDGSYQVVDASTGPYGVGTAAIYQRDVDLSLAASVTDIARLKVESYTADGVFTGVGFGVHDGLHLCVVGLLVIDTVQHVGILKDAPNAHLEAGWEIGPVAPATAISSTQITVSVADFPLGIESGSRFRIATGSQAGTYIIATCGLEVGPEFNTLTNQHCSWEVTAANSLVTITLDSTTPLPADILLEGNDSFSLLFEVKWDTDLVSFRTYAGFPAGSFQVYVGGAVSALVADVSEVLAFPAETALLIPAIEDLTTTPDPSGVVFWGSLSRRAMSVSNWDMVYYVSVPEQTLETVQGVTVLSEMGVTPEDDPHYPWYITRGFGYSKVDITGDTLLLKATSAAVSGTFDDSFAYARVEPFLSPKVTTDFEATFSVDSEILGTGDALVRLYDTEKQVELSTVTTTQNIKGHSLARVLPSVSISGLQAPVTDGWSKSTTFTIDEPFIRGQILILTKGATTTGHWDKAASSIGVSYSDGVLVEARIAVDSYTADGSGFIGPYFSADVPSAPDSDIYTPVFGKLIVNGGVPSLSLASSDGTPVVAVPFDWTDGEFHTYRLLCDPVADLVSVLIDDVLQTTVALSTFLSMTGTNADVRGSFGAEDGGSSISLWDSLSVVPLRRTASPTTTRTLGIWLGGDRDDINSYALPRTDGLDVENSSEFATFQAMDWGSPVRARLYYDPAWGVGLYRPDLPLPPTATEDFVTETTDPTAAWVNVEYADLPTAKVEHGLITFGASNPAAITQQRWDSVRYRIRAVPTGYGIAPEGMVLNRSIKITSGEFLEDVTPEIVTLTSISWKVVNIAQSAMYADRVFVVQVGASVLAATEYTFDPATQLLLLTDPLPQENYPVTVTFAPGKPVTKTYLCSQPIEGSVTLLNAGTPPVPMGRDGDVTREVVAGSIINDPHDVLDDAASLLTNDPTRVVRFTEDGTALYADLQFCEVEDGEPVHITSICDNPGPAHGFSGIGIEGTDYTNAFSVPEGPAGPWKGSPTIKGSATHFDPASVLVASGGAIVGGSLGPGTAILYSNARGPDGSVPPGMGMNQDFRLVLDDVTPRADSFPVHPAKIWMGDNVPPTYAIDPVGGLNPDGAPGTHAHGACVAEMLDYGSDPTSRLGPTGALTYFGELQILNNAAILAGDTIILGGVVLTASAGAPAVDEFQIGATATETVANIVVAINDTTNSFEGMCTAQVELPAPAFPQATFISGTALTFTISNSTAFLAKSDSGVFSKRAILGGGMQMNGYEFILSGGAVLPSPTVTTMVIQAAM